MKKGLVLAIVLTFALGALTLGVSWVVRGCASPVARPFLRALLGPAVAMLDMGTSAPETGKPSPGPHPHVGAVHVEAVGHWTPSETVTPADTLPVHIVINDTGDGPITGYVTIGADTVAVDSVLIRATVEPLDWRLFVEVTGPISADVGAGVAYEPIRLLGIQAGPALSFDVPDFSWLAVSGRISRRVYSTADVGASVGYRIGTDAGLFLSASAGFSF